MPVRDWLNSGARGHINFLGDLAPSDDEQPSVRVLNLWLAKQPTAKEPVVAGNWVAKLEAALA